MFTWGTLKHRHLEGNAVSKFEAVGQKPTAEPKKKSLLQTPKVLSLAAGIPLEYVQDICVEHGWIDGGTMTRDDVLAAARDLGLQMRRGTVWPASGASTLEKMIGILSESKRYLLSSQDNWVAVVNGLNRCKENSTAADLITYYWEVVPAQASRSARRNGYARPTAGKTVLQERYSR